MNEIGFFHAGGMLIGTHAFLAMGNALGVGWGDLARTQDLDLAHAGAHVQLALPGHLEIATRDALQSLESGFLPVPGLRPGEKTATFINKRDRHLRLDFVTPMKGGREDAAEHGPLGVPLQPLRFLEFVLEDIQQAAVVSALGATIVNIPDPARFALHKLLVFAERRQSFPQKALKDLRQGAALIEVLAAFRPDDLLALWGNLIGRGPGWRSRAKSAVRPLRNLIPDVEVAGKMAAMLDSSTIKAPKKRR